MTLKDLLKKKDKIKAESDAQPSSAPLSPPMPDVPSIQFMRTTTTSQESIAPPFFPGDQRPTSQPDENKKPKHLSIWRRPSYRGDTLSPDDRPKSARSEKRLSERLHLGQRSRSTSSTIELPQDLPDIQVSVARNPEDEAEWEKRATLLARGTSIRRPGIGAIANNRDEPARRPVTSPASGNTGGDVDIQEAITLHEAGDLERSTEMFCRLADPNGANNALCQVLYGLALRHGWGCTPDPEQAITYLSYAASNSAEVESLALAAGMKKGGAAKGELVLAIFELGNCFRQGWGVKKDAAAARQYYETAANLGDTDAMNEAAWCYVEGFGCKKDKFKAAQFLRLAEEKGNKTIGNTW
ncbi:uncharacterized protein K452DRAFT_294275 [Aplosporella prunicola CBS 121167]|uniref:HCP-like protein n=1 Tax=Aplosporella prunicola CBS 121167 TaxID=1176127 RepID=A0A6A6BV73_9PEZI|nr:uncharacterized protein K452DRAFT_294275 [Aplosporella prunicola CBS 121167]KAF2146727.1 hypothetical protein K452DRAFT_294275 [Aplosporella prunicola CBS 121167]